MRKNKKNKGEKEEMEIFEGYDELIDTHMDDLLERMVKFKRKHLAVVVMKFLEKNNKKFSERGKEIALEYYSGLKRDKLIIIIIKEYNEYWRRKGEKL